MKITKGTLFRDVAFVLALAVGGSAIPINAQTTAPTLDARAKRYEASGTTDPTAVKHVVNNLGHGRHVKLETSMGAWKGQIVDIDNDGFRFDPKGNEISPFDVRFTEVKALKGTMTTGSKVQIALWSSIGAVVVFGIIAARTSQ